MSISNFRELVMEIIAFIFGVALCIGLVHVVVRDYKTQARIKDIYARPAKKHEYARP
jgi:hypothetical protein